MLRWLEVWGPWIVVILCALVVTDEALAQSTGGSFGGGSFGGGGSSGGGGGGYSGGGDHGGDGLISFVIYVLLSRLPWPLKIALAGGAAGVFVVVKLVNKRKNQDPPDSS